LLLRRSNPDDINTDPVTPHTITWGVEPANTKLPSANVTLDGAAALS
jgi:hypothetical protein